MGCVLDESGTDVVKCRRKVASGRKAAVAIRSMVNAMGLQLKCARVLYEALIMLGLLYGSETVVWGEKERSFGHLANG